MSDYYLGDETAEEWAGGDDNPFGIWLSEPPTAPPAAVEEQARLYEKTVAELTAEIDRLETEVKQIRNVENPDWKAIGAAVLPIQERLGKLEQDRDGAEAFLKKYEQACDKIRNDHDDWRRAKAWDEGQRERELASKVEQSLVRKEASRRTEDAERVARLQDVLKRHNARPIAGTELADPGEVETHWRIGQLWEVNTCGIMFSQPKVGKSNMMINVARSLIDGVPFLGAFEVTPVTGIVEYVNTELPESLVMRWFAQAGIKAKEKLSLFNIDGAPIIYDILTESRRDEIAADLKSRGVEVLIIDPLGPLFTELGINENTPADIRRFWNALLALKRDAGLSEILCTHHTGYNDSHPGRGSSELEAVPGYYWHLQAGKAHDSQRRFSSKGRDTGMSSYYLAYEQGSHTYTLGAQVRRKGAQVTGDDDDSTPLSADGKRLVDALKAAGGRATAVELRDVTGFEKTKKWPAALDSAKAAGLVFEKSPAKGRTPAVLELVTLGEETDESD